MYKNWPFELKNQKLFLEREHSPLPRPLSGGEGDTSSPHPTPSVLLAPRSSRHRRSTRQLDSRTSAPRCLGPRRLHSPPSHTFWIRPCIWIAVDEEFFWSALLRRWFTDEKLTSVVNLQISRRPLFNSSLSVIAHSLLTDHDSGTAYLKTSSLPRHWQHFGEN